MALNLSTKTWWIWLICGTILGILISVLFSKGCIEPKTVERHIYRSDTVRLTIDKWHHDTITVPFESVLPEKVTIYETPDTVIWYKDTSLPDFWQYKPCYGYNQKFLSRFSGAPKFISGDFYKDSITLTLFDTSGTLIKRNWPISYNVFDYHFRDNNLLATEKKVSKSIPLQLPAGITTSSNVYGYYSPIYGGFSLSADYWVTKNRWSVGAIGELRTYEKHGDIRLGAKYQLK